MGWAGAGGGGAATVSVHLAYLFASFKYLDLTALDSGTFYFIGGLLMTLAGVLEFVLGNTFTFVVFCSFGEGL